MAQIFQINETTISTGLEASWDEQPVAAPLAGGTVFNRWRRHRWQTNVMSAVEFDALRGRLGQRVSLTTTDYSDLNGDYVTYYGATVDAVRGEHSGPNFVGVSVEFEVRV